jgi:hypothetical protein
MPLSGAPLASRRSACIKAECCSAESFIHSLRSH